MRAVVQRVSRAVVRVEGDVVGRIDAGLLVLLAVERGDGDGVLDTMVRKVAGLRIFADDNGRMNRAVAEVGGGVLVVSQFTLAADLKKGTRPSFDRAEEPKRAEELYDRFCLLLAATGLPVARGRFGAMMEVELINDGPVTLWLELPPEV